MDTCQTCFCTPNIEEMSVDLSIATASFSKMRLLLRHHQDHTQRSACISLVPTETTQVIKNGFSSTVDCGGCRVVCCLLLSLQRLITNEGLMQENRGLAHLGPTLMSHWSSQASCEISQGCHRVCVSTHSSSAHFPVFLIPFTGCPQRPFQRTQPTKWKHNNFCLLFVGCDNMAK